VSDAIQQTIDDFQKAIESYGLTPPTTIISDDRFHRFPTNGFKRDKSGWYQLRADGDIAVGWFGDWRTGLKVTWTGQQEDDMTQEERTAYRKRLKQIQREREKDEHQRHQQAQKEAKGLWDASTPAQSHPYLEKKKVQAHALRVGKDGRLIIPVLHPPQGLLRSLQFIDADGAKRFLEDGAIAGGYFTVGAYNPTTATLLIGEGFATVASAHEATGHFAIVAFGKANLKAVALAFRKLHPDAKIILIGDNDQDGGGQAQAREAATGVNGLVAIPSEEGCDWSDVHIQQGLDAVKQAIEAALSTPSKNPTQLHTPPALALEPNILKQFEEVMRCAGVVGEVRCAKIAYLSLTSRFLSDPVSIAVKGLSSSGKSFTVATTLTFFPPSAYVVFTAMSERALVFSPEEFSHRTLIIYEAVALQERREKDGNLTAYFVRSLLSEGRISYAMTLKNAKGEFTTKMIVKEGPTNAILTTTATELHGENETRLLACPTDDSQEQTKAIMVRMAEGKSTQPVQTDDWHALQNWLATAEHRVVVPFAQYLAEHIRPCAVRLRRDFKSLLRLIETHALLHQCSRPRDEQGRIVASAEDYFAVRELIADLIAHGVDATVPKTMRETVAVVQAADQEDGITVKQVAKAIRLDRSAAQRRLRATQERGYISNIEDKRGRPARFILAEPLPDESELLPKALEECVLHTPLVTEAAHHTVTPSSAKDSSGDVQVCSESEGGTKQEEEPFYDDDQPRILVDHSLDEYLD